MMFGDAVGGKCGATAALPPFRKRRLGKQCYVVLGMVVRSEVGSEKEIAWVVRKVIRSCNSVSY